MRTSPKRPKLETLVLAIALFVFSLVNATQANAQSGTVRPLPVPSSQAPVMRPPMGRRPTGFLKSGQSTVTGRVVYKNDGQPLKNVSVRVFVGNSDADSDLRQPRLQEIVALTNNRGEFQLGGLAAGKYYVTVEGPNIGTASGFGMKIPLPMSAIPRREEFEEIVPRHDAEFTVDGTNTVQIEIRIVRGGTLTGKVMSSKGAAAANILVSLLSRDTSGAGPFMARFSTQTDKNGDYRIENLPPGEYLVAAAVEDKRGSYDIRARMLGESQVFTYHPAVSNFREALSVRVDSGRETGGVNVTLVERNAFSVSGTVVRQQDGTPLAGATVMLRNKDAELNGPLAPGLAQRTTRTDSDGNWSFSNVLEGSYVATALVETSPNVRLSRTRSGPPNLADRERVLREARQPFVVVQKEVNLIGADIRGLSLAIAGPGSIRGSLTREDGGALPEGFVVFLELSREGGLPGRPMPVRTKPDGSFLVEGIQGGDVYLTVALPPDSPYFIKSLSANGDDPRQSPLKVVEGAEAGPLRVVISNGIGSLSGKVVSENENQGLSDYAVLLVPTEASKQRFRTAYLTARSGSDGSFSLKGEPGEYFVMARKRDEFPPIVTEDFVRSATSQAQRVLLVSGEQKQLTVRIPSGR